MCAYLYEVLSSARVRMLRAGASTPRLGCTFAGYLWEGGGAGEGLPSPGGVHKAVNKLAASRVAPRHPVCAECLIFQVTEPSPLRGLTGVRQKDGVPGDPHSP